MSDERGERKRGYGDSYRNDRGGNKSNLFSCLCIFFQPNLRPSPDYQRKRYRNDDRPAAEGSRRAPDSDQAVLAMLLLVFIIQCPVFIIQCPTPLVCFVDLRLLIKHSVFLLQEKNPRFREKGDSDEEEDDYDKRRRRWTCVTIVACMQLFWCPVTAEESTKCSSICFTLLCTTDWLILVEPVLWLVPVIC